MQPDTAQATLPTETPMKNFATISKDFLNKSTDLFIKFHELIYKW